MPAIRVSEFDVFRAGYGAATVKVYIAGTTTLASLFSDETLSLAIDNPQTLTSTTVGGVTGGKFAQAVYVGSAYFLEINSTDNTGVVRVPLYTLSGSDAKAATLRATGGSVDVTLADFAARTIDVRDYGEFKAVGESGASASTNTTTLTAAIGAAAANGGGAVRVPPGTFAFNQVTLSAGVVLLGYGRGVSTLQSQVGDKAVTLSGDRAGFAKLTLDGVSIVASSVGVFSKANDETFFDDVDVKRFETGLHYKGGRRARWADLYVTNCATGAKLHGDIDSGGGADGDEFRHNAWVGGLVSECTSIGVECSWEDKLCIANSFLDVGFKDNVGTAVKINGARYTAFENCWWKGNTTNLAVQDDADTSDDARAENTVVNLEIDGGEISGGAATFTGTCQDVILSRLNLVDVDFTLSTPISNNIAIRDCTEDGNVTISGEGTKYSRFWRVNEGQTSGITTDATTTKAWEIALQPGQKVYLEGIVVARQRNGVDDAYYHISVSANRPGSTLAYDSQTANFTVGTVLTGQSSGATGRIVADSDSGTTGTLTLQDIAGTFLDNELITDTSTGSATVNGTLTGQNAALKGSVTAIRAAQETDANWAATFAANGSAIELQVTGAASKTVEWEVSVRVVSN